MYIYFIKLVNRIVQIHNLKNILSAILLLCDSMLKSLHIIVDLSNYLCNSISFCFLYFKGILVDNLYIYLLDYFYHYILGLLMLFINFTLILINQLLILIYRFSLVFSWYFSYFYFQLLLL